ENHRPRWVYRHKLGTPSTEDVLIYEEADPGFFVSVGRSRSGRFLEIAAYRHECSEVRVLDASDVKSTPRLIAPRRDGHEYDIDHIGEQFIIVTNSGDAIDKRICVAPVDAPDEANWSELIAHQPGRLILGTDAFANHLVRLERINALPRIIIRDWQSGDEHAIAFDEDAYALGLSSGYEFETASVRFSYSSMTTPSEVYDYDMTTRARTLRKRQEVPSGHDPSAYVTRRIMAPARDGETVPVSILHHRDTPIDGSAPLFVYGYGSYGISMPAGTGNALADGPDVGGRRFHRTARLVFAL
ncbi:MAG: S9 family peptidase, partial [Pseudomonadota bacterium]